MSAYDIVNDLFLSAYDSRNEANKPYVSILFPICPVNFHGKISTLIFTEFYNPRIETLNLTRSDISNGTHGPGFQTNTHLQV